MGEIKFRAFGSQGQGMFNVNMLNLEDMSVDGVTSCKIMQYTGLKDKNGKEIYEGDIVKLINGGEYKGGAEDSSHMEGIGVVEYVGLTFVGKQEVGSLQLNWGGTESKEVIGNIYENPELIKDTK